MQTVQVQISLASKQSDRVLHYLLTESLDTTECMNREQRTRWYFVHTQNGLNGHILHMFKSTFSLDGTQLLLSSEDE